MKLKTIKIISILGIFIISFLSHFIYQIIPNFITSIFFPVNESIFEHMKIIFTSTLYQLPTNIARGFPKKHAIFP